MTQMEMYGMMEKSLDDFERKLVDYARRTQRIERLHDYIMDGNAEIAYLEELIKDIPRQIEKIKSTQKTFEKSIEEITRENEELLSSWNGTFIKDSDNEKLSECPSFSAKPHRKAQLPCSNHTYKDLRFLGDCEDRKCMKHMKQSKIKKQFTDCDIKLFFKAKEEYDDANF